MNDKSEGDSISEPVCPLCKGARFVHPLKASGHPDFGRVVPCRCTHEELQVEKIARLQRYSNLGTLSRLTFDTLLPDGRQVDIGLDYNFTEAYEAARTFADDPEGWLIFIGPSGCGKTHLACAIANYRVSLVQPVFYIGTADLLDHLRSTIQSEADIAYDELFEKIKNVPVLVLDDLTMGVTTQWAKDKLEQLLNHRFNSQLPTVITTYVPVEGMEESLQGHLADPDFCRVVTIQRESLDPLEHLGDLELLKKMSFENFDRKRLDLSSEKRQNLEHAFRNAFNFAQSPQDWLVFLGVNGCGKTHLAAAIANHLHKAGKSALFIVVPELLDHLRSAFSPDSNVSYDKLFEKVKKAPVLILDDFGEQSATPWAQEKLYQLINYRYNARLATVITTCYNLDEIENRISSRMVDPSLSLVFNILASDYRGDKGSSQGAKSRQRYSQRGSKP